jgi:hypothetical protein
MTTEGVQFRPNGCLSAEVRAYVERQFERDMFTHLSRHEWVSLLGPPKYGKSSSLMRVRATLMANGYSCAYVDLQRGRRTDRTYDSFLAGFAETVATELGTSFDRPRKRHRSQLESWLKAIVTDRFTNVAILIDEVSAVPEAFRLPFFSQLTALSTSKARTDMPDGELAARLVFAFAGTFLPSRLIDNANSPFNVSNELKSDDLTEAEIEKLAAIGLGGDAHHYAEQALIETNGQPFYVQDLFAAVQAAGDRPDLRASAFEARLAALRRGAGGHLVDLARVVKRNADIEKLVPRILDGSLRFQVGDEAHEYAIIAGVARNDAGFLVARNPIYARALVQFAEERFP